MAALVLAQFEAPSTGFAATWGVAAILSLVAFAIVLATRAELGATAPVEGTAE